MFDEFVKEIIGELEAKESKKRARSDDAQGNFEYAVRFILEGLWKKSLSFPPSESFINLRSGYYSELPRYKDQKLTYRQVKAAFDGMIECRFIEVTSKGSHFKELLTGFVATDQLLARMENLEGHPAFVLSPPSDEEIIILRDKIGDQKVDVDYKDTPKTERFRSNLKKINQCFLKHWADLRIKNIEYHRLAELILQDEDKEPIDLSRRTLTRIFANGSFEKGGRFYRG